MSIKKIMELAEVQANKRVEAAQASLSAINAQMAQLQATRQLAIDELTAANAAKAKLEGMLDEYCETQEQPKKVAANAIDNPRVVHIINSNSRKLREL